MDHQLNENEALGSDKLTDGGGGQGDHFISGEVCGFYLDPLLYFPSQRVILGFVSASISQTKKGEDMEDKAVISSQAK
ncbi:hypothetical protein ACLB2K_013024 [Fragaria x ananassa]